MATQLSADMRGKSSQILKIRIGAGLVYPGKATGTNLYLYECPTEVLLRLDTSSFVHARQGTGLRAQGGAVFEGFEIWNTSAHEIEVKVYVGFAEYIDTRAEVMDPPTAVTGSGVITLAAGGSVTLPGTPPLGCIRRKSILLTNFDLANAIMIETPAGVAIGACLPRTAWRENISGAVKLSNPSGGGISMVYGEVWNASV